MGRASRAGAVVLLVAIVNFTACGTADTTDQTGSARQASTVTRERVSATLPQGWAKVEMPAIRSNPDEPLFTVSSAPVSVDRPPDICHTRELVDQLPASGALVQVNGWAPQRLPGRPDPIALDRSTFDIYECSGRSHQLAFHQNGRGIQITAWFDPDRVDPRVRRQAVAFLNSLDVKGFPSRECPRVSDVADLQRYAPGFEGTDGLSCRDAVHVWSNWLVPDRKLIPCTKAGSTHNVRITEGTITCGVAERFIVGGVRGFTPHPGGWVERSDRFTCRIQDSRSRADQRIRVDCLTDRGTEGPRFTFRFA